MINKNNDYNKRILIATILSTVLIISWIKYYARKTLPEAKQFEEMQELKKKEREKILDEKAKKIKEEKELNKNNDNQDTKKSTLDSQNEVKLKIETEKLSGSINLRGLVLNNLVLKDYKASLNSENNVQLLDSQNSNNPYFVTFSWESENKNIDLPNINTVWKADSDVLKINNPVTLTYTNKQNIVFQVIVSIDENYMFTFEQKVKNNSNNALSFNVLNKIYKNSITNKRKSVSAYEGFISSFGEQIEEIKFSKLKKKKEFTFDNGFNWAGFTDTYWLVAMASYKKQNKLFTATTDYLDNNYIINIKGNTNIVSPEQTITTSTLLFAGPKILSLLDNYAFQYDLPLFDRALDFGWFYFLTKPIYMLLKVFNNFFQNFGISILFLTLVIKLIMYPFTKKSYISMARMKQLQPKMDAIKARYSDDKMKMNKELVELYNKEKISPLSGCLPMLVQIPVFFSLYKVLVISIDMRQAPFIGYIKDLSVKDPTTIWNLFGLLPFQTNFLQIGLLPCLMSLTMWIQQSMTNQSSSNDEVQKATKWMPIIFLIIFAGMPAGLLIYWTFSNILTILQQYYLEKTMKNIKK